MPERYEFRKDLLHESARTGVTQGPVSATAGAEVTVGEIMAEAEVDPEKLTAKARAKAVTVHVEADGSVHTPVGHAQGEVEATGPEAEATAAVSPDGAELGVGASAGEVGASGEVEAAGMDWGAGVHVGVKAELGVKLGSTTEIDLPFISLEAPNPYLGAAEYATRAVVNLAKDPEGTIQDAVDDVTGGLEDGIDAVVDTAEDAAAVFGLGSGHKDSDDHAVTNDDWGDAGPPPPPGSHRID